MLHTSRIVFCFWPVYWRLHHGCTAEFIVLLGLHECVKVMCCAQVLGTRITINGGSYYTTRSFAVTSRPGPRGSRGWYTARPLFIGQRYTIRGLDQNRICKECMCRSMVLSDWWLILDLTVVIAIVQ